MFGDDGYVDPTDYSELDRGVTDQEDHEVSLSQLRASYKDYLRLLVSYAGDLIDKAEAIDVRNDIFNHTAYISTNFAPSKTYLTTLRAEAVRIRREMTDAYVKLKSLTDMIGQLSIRHADRHTGILDEHLAKAT